MFTHKLDPVIGGYVPLQLLQAKRLNGIFSLDVSNANKLTKIKSADLYKNSPMLFPSYVDAYRTCAHIIVDMIKIQSLRKVTAVWPMLRSLGTSDGWTFQDLVKVREDYHKALRLLLSYAVVVESWDKIWGPVPGTKDNAVAHTMPQSLDPVNQPIGLPAYDSADTYLEDTLRAELVLPDYKYKTNFLGALKALNQAKEEAERCRS